MCSLTVRLGYRLLHGLYEDMQLLFANPVLPLLAIALANDVFKDYHTFEEIEAIPPPADGSLHYLRIKKEMFDVPFLQQKSRHGFSGKIIGACPFGTRLVALGHRAGYPENIHVHDFRREVLVKADGKSFVRSPISLAKSLALMETVATRRQRG
jgi:hypothetical protein